MADQVTMPLHALLLKVVGAGGERVLLDGISSLQAERAEETGTDSTAGTRPVTSSLAWLVLADLLADNGWQDGAPGLLCLCIPQAQCPNAHTSECMPSPSLVIFRCLVQPSAPSAFPG